MMLTVMPKRLATVPRYMATLGFQPRYKSQLLGHGKHTQGNYHLIFAQCRC